jgi:hypothetical protein
MISRRSHTVMPAKAGIHDFLATIPGYRRKSGYGLVGLSGRFSEEKLRKRLLTVAGVG